MLARWILALTAALAGCAPESVEAVVLSPETPELAEVLRAADARWEAAGVAPDRIQIGPGGAPVRLVPERAPIAETRTIGRGRAFAGVRWMELYSLDVDLATHEVGHALGIKWHLDQLDSPDPECADDAHRPTMCSTVGGVIGAQDVELACEAGDCTHFSPEG